MEVLNGSVDIATDADFRVLGNWIVTYTQNKLGLGAYHDKRVVVSNGVYTEPLY